MKKLKIIFWLFLTATAIVRGQTAQLTGKVTSLDDGSALPGVTISIKGTSSGTMSEIDGTYSLAVPQDATTLVFSFVGYKTMEVAIEGRRVIDIALEIDILKIDEVLVVAYGTTKKEAFTGSASSVKVDKLSDIQASNVTKALEGLSSGIQVLSGSGQPGTETTVTDSWYRFHLCFFNTSLCSRRFCF